MPLVQFSVSFDDKPKPRVLAAEARAVAAEPYLSVDEEAGDPGGVTRADIADGDIRPLGTFEDGAEVYVESPDPTDALDDTDESTDAETHIWWRAVILLPEVAE